MIIRPAQMEQLQEVQLEQFHIFMVTFLRRHFPEETESYSDENLRDSVSWHTQEAAQYSIVDENSVAKFVYLKWFVGDDFEDFPDRPWLIGLLEDDARPAIQRLDIALDAVQQLEDTSTLDRVLQ